MDAATERLLKQLCTNQTTINFGETVEIILTRKEWMISIVHSFVLPIHTLQIFFTRKGKRTQLYDRE